MKLETPTLIPYFTAGWPDDDGFVEAVKGAGQAGCSHFEVGFPFTDPVADGPVIQRTSAEALARGVNYRKSLELTRRATDETGLGAVVMTYANLVWHPGPEKFCQQIAEAGAEGLIVPDLPLDESEELEQITAAAGIDLVQLCSPTTPAERAARLAARTRGFLYLVSVKGVTGARTELPPEIEELIERAKRECSHPVCVGFGISTPEQAARVAASADGVIVGSALLRQIESLNGQGVQEGVYTFLNSFRQAMARV